MLIVEMQVSIIRGLLERMVYYASSMYVEQLSAGDNYAMLRPAISICLLTRRIFDSHQPHHRFQMVDLASRRHVSRIKNALIVAVLARGFFIIRQATKDTWSALVSRKNGDPWLLICSNIRTTTGL